MKSIGFFFLIMVFMCCAIPASANENNIYGTKLLSVDDDYLRSLLPETERPKEGDKPSAEWILYDGLRYLSKFQFDPVWSPDSQWIACRGRLANPSIWLIPVDGGNPVHVYTHYLMYKDYYLNGGVIRTCDFTPDGEEILFRATIIDETQGTVVSLKYHEDGSIRGASINGFITLIMSVNIYTGEIRTVLENGYHCRYSHNGKYFAYSQTTIDGLTVVDTETGDTWLLEEVPKYHFCFSSEDDYIIYSRDQLYRIPLRGGESEQVTFYNGDDLTTLHGSPDCSPDGEWILFSGYGGPRSGTVSDSTGTSSYSSSNVSKLCAYNLFSDETTEFFPRPPAISSWQGSFSPDGTKFCYNYENKDQRHQSIEIYIKDFDLESQKPELNTSVVSTSPLSFALHGNYPNPFNLYTTIEFSLPESDFVDLVIYSVTGQKIHELVSGHMTAGVHNVVWDGSNDSGLPVSTGVYLTRLNMGNAVTSGRMMLVK